MVSKSEDILGFLALTYWICARVMGTLSYADKKKEGELLALFLCFYEIECSDHYQNHAYYAFNVIWRKHLAGWVVGSQDGIPKQKCSDSARVILKT